ncbi:MAG: hypothetical protein J6T06_11100, partial [Victivallales bacterium]|nr:hypothetical protein [Victivallales bacterium]
MKKLFAFLSLLVVALPAAPFDEFVLFSPDKMPASGSYPGMKNELAPKPGSPEEKALKVVYPEYKQKGDPEWPAVYFNKPNFNGVDLDGWDAFTFAVYNPQPAQVDLGVCLDGPKKRWTKHIMLEPSSWNRIMLPVSEFKPTVGDSIVKFDLFMTRPAKELTLFYERIALVKRNLQNDIAVAKAFPLITFDKPQPLKFPFLFYTLLDGKIGYDWSAFAALSVTTTISGDVTPVIVTIADAHGKVAKSDFLQNPGTEEKWHIPLRKTGLDLKCIRLATISAKTKDNGEATLKALHLIAPQKDDILQMKAPLENVRRQIDAIPPERRGTLLEDYEKIVANFAEGEKAAASAVAVSSMSQLRKLADSERLLQDWFAKHGRQLDEEYIIAQTVKAFPQSPFGVAVADSMTKVMINDLPLKDVAFAKQIELEMAQNEYESVQIVAIGNREATASVAAGPLTNGVYTLPSDAVCVAVVGHVKCEKP